MRRAGAHADPESNRLVACEQGSRVGAAKGRLGDRADGVPCGSPSAVLIRIKAGASARDGRFERADERGSMARARTADEAANRAKPHPTPA